MRFTRGGEVAAEIAPEIGERPAFGLCFGGRAKQHVEISLEFRKIFYGQRQQPFAQLRGADNLLHRTEQRLPLNRRPNARELIQNLLDGGPSPFGLGDLKASRITLGEAREFVVG